MIDIVGDCWVLLIVCDVFDGVCCFGDFCVSFGVVSNILFDWLKMLVDVGVFDVVLVFDGIVY